MENKYSMEIIRARKLEKKEELNNSKDKIFRLTQRLFAPPQTKSKMELIMHNFNSGMAAYDGIMTGIRIYRRVKDILGIRKSNRAVK